eukprot:TRINITY_DN15975_c0_g1_i1.p1 TRINITY_DN15975_c0_g1~~TRINITY_DN15975_c0_g1_i1.p1  ORF type:complete len:312 (+),score=27.01 TRINITY_DN15975_c0_g1_i1:439-1374(+)
MRKDLNIHEEVCPYRIVSCNFCKKQMQFRCYQDHLANCPQNPERTTICNICSSPLKQKEISTHNTSQTVLHISKLHDIFSQQANQLESLEQEFSKLCSHNQILGYHLLGTPSVYPWHLHQTLCISAPRDAILLEFIKQLDVWFESIYGKQLFVLRQEYNSSLHGLSEEAFYAHLQKTPTFLVIMNDQKDIFGGFVSFPWDIGSKDELINDPYSFVYTLKQSGSQIFKVKEKNATQISAVKPKARRPIFGCESQRAIIVNLENGRCGANRQAKDFGISNFDLFDLTKDYNICLLYTSPSPRDRQKSRMPSSA